MPCFKGLAVSIHTPDGPLPEYGIQKQSRQSRISSYIPVPTPKIDISSGLPEQSTFAVSITLLTPGQAVPYSTPKPTADNPYPSAKIVGGLPGLTSERGRFAGAVGPYIPLTTSPNETVAAYIHFDGRAKEEVATLLRRSEETWVNSRWVSVPDSEGGGLAEREFLFREVGLERWLSGMDISGSEKEVAAKVARRKERLERKRRKRLEAEKRGSDDDFDPSNPGGKKKVFNAGGSVLRYGEDKDAPLESLQDDDDDINTDSDSDGEEPIPEAAGQIKVALYRVLASGEVKKGEYSPQFDAHDDDDAMAGDGGDADVDHTTTFAKPKTLDPKSISTQTVTGIDAPDSPYATFTFFYRGTKQLQKMGIVTPSSTATKDPTTTKRKTGSVDFSRLGPLKSKGTIGFAGYRDPTAKAKKKNGLKNPSDDDDMSDDDDDDDSIDEGNKRKLSNGGPDPDEAQEPIVKSEEDLTEEEKQRRKELAEGVKKMQLKRQHSVDPPARGPSDGTRTTPPATSSGAEASNLTSQTQLFPPGLTSSNSAPATSNSHLSAAITADSSHMIGSPMKKQRPSIAESQDSKTNSGTPASAAFPSNGAHDALSQVTGAATSVAPPTTEIKEEEL